METLVPAAVCRHGRIRVATERRTEFVDLTARIEALAAEAGIHTGLVNIQSQHTTTAIVVNEHEPLLLTDFDALLTRAAPRDTVYRHDDMDVRTVNLAPGERPNGHAHCHALLLGGVGRAERRGRASAAGPLAACLPRGARRPTSARCLGPDHGRVTWQT